MHKLVLADMHSFCTSYRNNISKNPRSLRFVQKTLQTKRQALDLKFAETLQNQLQENPQGD